MRMLAAAPYLDNAGVFSILTILAAVFAISIGRALAHTMRAFLVLSHVITPCSDVSMVGLENRMVKRIAVTAD